MEKKSCGAIFYAFSPAGELGIILGEECRGNSDGWLPFKGGIQEDETPEQAAIREIYEETGGLVQVQTIRLEHHFTTKRKEYQIGLCEVPYSIIEDFNHVRRAESREEFKEKKSLKFFPFKTVLDDMTVHNISKASIRFYKHRLDNLTMLRGKSTERMRCQGVSVRQAELIRSSNAPYIQSGFLNSELEWNSDAETTVDSDYKKSKQKRYGIVHTTERQYSNAVDSQFWRKPLEQS